MSGDWTRCAMTAEECHQRASDCAAKASLAASEPVQLEFLKLAAQWRAMAGRVIFLGVVDEPATVLGARVAPSLPLG